MDLTVIRYGEVETARRMSDGSPITGYIIGERPWLYILPEKQIREAIASGDGNQIGIKLTAERILSYRHDGCKDRMG